MTTVLELTISAIHLPNTPPPDGWNGPDSRPIEVDAWQITLTGTEVDPAPAGQQIGTPPPPRTMSFPFYSGDGNRVASFGNRPPEGGAKIRRAKWHDTVPGSMTTFGKSSKYRDKGTPPYLFAKPPYLGEVLECCVSDALVLDECNDEFDFIENYGGDASNASALRGASTAYRACIEQERKLRSLLGRFWTNVVPGPEDGWSSVKDPTITIERTTA